MECHFSSSFESRVESMDDSQLLQPEKSIALPQLEHLSQWMSQGKIDGSKGTNREQVKNLQIRANNDYEAIQCWLNEYRQKVTTYRTYQKEVERFLLWSICQRQKALSSLDRDDLEAYLKFLDDPSPKEIWCSASNGRGRTRGSIAWRPFRGPLGKNAKKTAISALDSLFSYLVDARYLSFNPFSLMRKRNKINSDSNQHILNIQERILEMDEWDAMLDTIEKMPYQEEDEKFEKERIKFLVAILYFLGLRINELENHTWNAFRKQDDKWWFYVIGKGDKQAKIPVNDGLLRMIINYRAFLNWSPLPAVDDTRYLIHSKRTKKKITARQMNKILKNLALETAKNFTNPEKISKLEKFSAHWLRHLSASMQDRSGILFKHVRANLRHENDDTTRLYVHALDDERHQDMQKLKLKYSMET